MKRIRKRRKSRIIKPLSECRWSTAWRTCWAARWNSSPNWWLNDKVFICLCSFQSLPVLQWFAQQSCEGQADWEHHQLHPVHNQFQEPRISILNLTSLYFHRLPSRSRLGSHQPMVSGWPDNKQIAKQENFLRQLLTRGLNTTRSIPLKPKSEIFAGIPFTWKQRISQLLFVTHIFTLNSTTRLLAKTMSRSIIISFLLMFCSCILIPVILGGTCPKVFKAFLLKRSPKNKFCIKIKQITCPRKTRSLVNLNGLSLYSLNTSYYWVHHLPGLPIMYINVVLLYVCSILL